jgi:photosystem II stability/assembly factor-like uncharacterized protein
MFALLLVAAALAAPPLSAVKFADGRNGWAAGSGIILATTDGGRTWRRQHTGGEAFRSLEFVDAAHGWAVAARRLLRTTDGGGRWARVAEPPEPLERVDFVSATVGWGTGGGMLSRSGDGGRSWRPVRRGIDSVCFSDPRTGWAAGHGSVLRTGDGGRSWRSVFSAPRWLAPQTGAAVGCAGRLVAYVYFVDGGAAGNIAQVVYRTVDGGRQWRPVLAEGMLIRRFPGLRAQTENYPGPFQVVDARHAVFLGFCPQCERQAAAVLSVTSDAGLRWTRRRVPVRCAPVSGDVWFVDSAHGWIALPECRELLATADGGRSWRRVF